VSASEPERLHGDVLFHHLVLLHQRRVRTAAAFAAHAATESASTARCTPPTATQPAVAVTAATQPAGQGAAVATHSAAAQSSASAGHLFQRVWSVYEHHQTSCLRRDAVCRPDRQGGHVLLRATRHSGLHLQQHHRRLFGRRQQLRLRQRRRQVELHRDGGRGDCQHLRLVLSFHYVHGAGAIHYCWAIVLIQLAAPGAAAAAAAGPAARRHVAAAVHQFLAVGGRVLRRLRDYCAPQQQYGGIDVLFGRHSQRYLHRKHAAGRPGHKRKHHRQQQNNPRVRRVQLYQYLRQPHHHAAGHRRAPEVRLRRLYWDDCGGHHARRLADGAATRPVATAAAGPSVIGHHSAAVHQLRADGRSGVRGLRSSGTTWHEPRS
jgi:hypothetical protein